MVAFFITPEQSKTTDETAKAFAEIAIAFLDEQASSCNKNETDHKLADNQNHNDGRIN